MVDTLNSASPVDGMPLWKNGGFVEDPWTVLDDNAPVPAGGPVFVSLHRWRNERDDLARRDAPVGLLLSPDSDWTDVANRLADFPAIAVHMPKFADGRAFSIARLLRERDGYTGEIRAVGDYFIDQVPLMARVGVDAFQTEDPILIRAFENGEWPEVTNYMQPALGKSEVPAGTRPWARKRGAKG